MTAQVLGDVDHEVGVKEDPGSALFAVSHLLGGEVAVVLSSYGRRGKAVALGIGFGSEGLLLAMEGGDGRPGVISACFSEVKSHVSDRFLKPL